MNSFVRRVAWGMRIINTPPESPPSTRYAAPKIETASRRRAQIGTRPVQMHTPGDAGQSYDQRSGDLLQGPARPSKMDDASGLNYGDVPFQIQRFFRSANTGYVSLVSNGWPMTGDNWYILKRPLQRFPTRGARSVSGAMNAKSRWDDTGRVPSVFVPTTPVR